MWREVSSQEAGQLQGQGGCPETLGPWHPPRPTFSWRQHVAESQDLADMPCLSVFLRLLSPTEFRDGQAAALGPEALGTLTAGS